MKRYTFIILIGWVSINLYSAKTYNFKFDKNDFEFVEDRGEYHIIPRNDKLVFIDNDTIMPALPYYFVDILLPQGTQVSNITYDINSIEIIPNVTKIVRNYVSVPTDNKEQKKESAETKYPLFKYPQHSVTLVKQEKYGQYSYAVIKLCPFIYEVNEKLSFASDITISLSLKKVDRVTNESIKGDVGMIKNMVINPEDINSYYGQQTQKGATRSDETIDYIIITRDSLASSFEPLALWKTMKGVKTRIISLEYIYATYTGATSQLKIKNCLKDYAENKNLKWALLGGDDIIVPVQGCYGYVYTTPTPEEDYNIPCDLFYACFSGALDWNADGDAIIGAPSDNVVLIPDIYLSRLPIRTNRHVRDYVQKLLRYEQHPDITYINKMLLCGTKLWDYNSSDGLSDAQYKSEKMYNEYIAPYWSGTKHKLYDTDTDFGGASYDETATHINDQINLGYHFVHNASHGNWNLFSVETGNYSVYDALSLTNNINPCIFLTMSCLTNNFDNSSDPCLSEAFIRNSNGGAICYFGSSRVGWGFQTILSLGPSFSYNSMFYKKIFNEKIYNFTEIAAEAKLFYKDVSSNNGAWRWLQYSLNPIGDPEMPIYTDNPLNFNNVTITMNDNVMTVETNGIPNCTFSLTNPDFSYFQVVKENSIASFQNPPEFYTLVITKHNYIPYISSTDCSIQDKTIEGNAFYSGCDTLKIGRDIMQYCIQGDVVVEDGGVLDIENNGEVFIKNGFNVNIGGELFIH